jgi:hypothetical protein
LDRDHVIFALIILVIGIQVTFGISLLNQINEIKGSIADAEDKISNQMQYLPNQQSPTPATMPSTEISTSPKTATPIVNILKPAEKDAVSWREWVNGTSSASEGSGLNATVLIWPMASNGPWWVQTTTTYSDGSWDSHAYIGRDSKIYPDDIGGAYKIIAILTEQRLNGGDPYRELPPHVSKSREVIVTRT